jgi:putative phosphoesterase
MRLVVFSDVHGNKLALDVILRDIEKQRPDKIFCLGDLVGYGPRPNEVIETIWEKKIQCILGNYDDGVGFERGSCGCAYLTEEDKQNGQRSIEWTTSEVTTKNKTYLRNLPEKIEIKVVGRRVLLVHGSPRRINEYLFEDRPKKSLKRILDSTDADILICGHTHQPYHRIIDDYHVINDGSVGKPKDGDNRACYALIDISEAISVDFIRVAYQVEEVAQEIKVGLPSAFAKALRNA